MPVAKAGGIFVSYRRQESSDFAGRLYDRLVNRFGEGQVFMDVVTIEPGTSFARKINRAVMACTVLLAIIGPNWLTATDKQGRRRLDDPDDFVRLEIEAALVARGVWVIPILAEGAVMPGREDLPQSLAGLAHRSAMLIRHESFRSDTGRLVMVIERVLAAAGTATVQAARLLVDAERIAYSAKGKSSKVQALTSIAEILAATDPERATRLFASAERIACSIIRKRLKAEALSSVAEVSAATDPDRAERIAHSIGDRYWKAQTLSRVAKALAATHPDRAERIARSIAGKSSKVPATSGVAEALEPADPELAALLLAVAEPIGHSSDQYWKAQALIGVAEALAATHPDRAERIARSIGGDVDLEASTLSGIAKVLAATDPDRAEPIAHSIGDRYWKQSALSGIAKTLAATDPDRAEPIARSITDGDAKVSALSGVAEALAAADPERAARLLADAEPIARSIVYEPSKASALSQLAKVLSFTFSA